MSDLTRRRALRGLGAAGVLGLAGCTAPAADPDPGDDGVDTGGTDDGKNETGDGDGENGTDDADDDPIVEVHAVAVDRTGAGWDYRERPGFCALVTDARDAAWLFDEADAAATAFVEDTDFESSVIVYVESVGPNTCYNELEVADVAVENGTVVGSAAAIDASDADADVCAPSLTYPGALIRVTADPRPDSARITVTDGWENTAEVTPEDGIIDPGSLPGFVRPEGDPETVPSPLDCENGFERHYAGYGDDVSWGAGAGIDGRPGLELRIVEPDDDGEEADSEGTDGEGTDDGEEESVDDRTEPTTFARGDEVRVELTNVSTTTLGTGNHGKYNLESYTEEGWTDVRGFDADGPPAGYTDELLPHPPGETVSWTFTMTEEGIVEGHQHEDRLRVCPELRPGRYRFVFWGSDDVAVAFDYEG